MVKRVIIHLAVAAAFAAVVATTLAAWVGGYWTWPLAS
jgi:hypothetical protein